MSRQRSDRASSAGEADERDRGGTDTAPRSRRSGSGTSDARRSSPTCCAASPSCRRRSAAPSAAPPTRPAGRSRRAIDARAAQRSRPRARCSARAGPGRRHAARPTRPPPVGRLHLITRTRQEIEDVFIGLGYRSRRAPRSSASTTTSTRSTSRRRTRPAETDTFYIEPAHDMFDPRRCCCASTPRRCRSARWRASRLRST